MARTDKSIKTKSRLVVAWVWLEGEKGNGANVPGVSFGDDKNLLKLVVRAVQLCEYTKTT